SCVRRGKAGRYRSIDTGPRAESTPRTSPRRSSDRGAGGLVPPLSGMSQHSCGPPLDQRVVAQPVAVRPTLADPHKDMLGQPVVLAPRGVEARVAAQVVLLVRHGRAPLKGPVTQLLHGVGLAAPQKATVVEQDQSAVLLLEHVARIENRDIVGTEIGVVAAG